MNNIVRHSYSLQLRRDDADLDLCNSNLFLSYFETIEAHA